MRATVVPINRQPSWMVELLTAFPLSHFKQSAYYVGRQGTVREIP